MMEQLARELRDIGRGALLGLAFSAVPTIIGAVLAVVGFAYREVYGFEIAQNDAISKIEYVETTECTVERTIEYGGADNKTDVIRVIPPKTKPDDSTDVSGWHKYQKDFHIKVYDLAFATTEKGYGQAVALACAEAWWMAWSELTQESSPIELNFAKFHAAADRIDITNINPTDPSTRYLLDRAKDELGKMETGCSKKWQAGCDDFEAYRTPQPHQTPVFPRIVALMKYIDRDKPKDPQKQAAELPKPKIKPKDNGPSLEKTNGRILNSVKR